MPTGDLKHRAKRWNERVKLVATPFSSVAIVTLAAALIDPIASKHDDVLADGGWILLFGAASSHAASSHNVGQIVLTFFRAEA